MAKNKNNKLGKESKDRTADVVNKRNRKASKGAEVRQVQSFQGPIEKKPKQYSTWSPPKPEHPPEVPDNKRRLEGGDNEIPSVIKKPRFTDSSSNAPQGAQAENEGNSSAWPSASGTSPSKTATSSLEDTHILTTISIISSSKIEARVTRILTTLSTFSFTDPKPPVVQLAAKPRCSNKLVSVAEIVKREIAKQGHVWYQYNTVESQVMERKTGGGEKKKIATIMGREIMEDDEDDTTMANGMTGLEEGKNDMEMDAEEDFETMKTPLERAIEGRPKIRAVPVMTTWLSRVRIDALKAAFGYA